MMQPKHPGARYPSGRAFYNDFTRSEDLLFSFLDRDLRRVNHTIQHGGGCRGDICPPTKRI